MIGRIFLVPTATRTHFVPVIETLKSFNKDFHKLCFISAVYNARKLNAVIVVLPKGSWVITKLPEHFLIVNATHVRSFNSGNACLLERKEAH